jgi:hypothetical protein
MKFYTLQILSENRYLEYASFSNMLFLDIKILRKNNLMNTSN